MAVIYLYKFHRKWRLQSKKKDEISYFLWSRVTVDNWKRNYISLLLLFPGMHRSYLYWNYKTNSHFELHKKPDFLSSIKIEEWWKDSFQRSVSFENWKFIFSQEWTFHRKLLGSFYHFVRLMGNFIKILLIIIGLCT